MGLHVVQQEDPCIYCETVPLAALLFSAARPPRLC
jgi:hypothetical protein